MQIFLTALDGSVGRHQCAETFCIGSVLLDVHV